MTKYSFEKGVEIKVETREDKPIVGEFPRLVVISPDGVQGPKLKVGLINQEDEEKLKRVFTEMEQGQISPSVRNLLPRLEKVNIHRVDN